MGNNKKDSHHKLLICVLVLLTISFIFLKELPLVSIYITIGKHCDKRDVECLTRLHLTLVVARKNKAPI